MKFGSARESKKLRRKQRQGKLVQGHPRQKVMKRNKGWCGKLTGY